MALIIFLRFVTDGFSNAWRRRSSFTMPVLSYLRLNFLSALSMFSPSFTCTIIIFIVLFICFLLILRAFADVHSFCGAKLGILSRSAKFFSKFFFIFLFVSFGADWGTSFAGAQGRLLPSNRPRRSSPRRLSSQVRCRGAA